MKSLSKFKILPFLGGPFFRTTLMTYFKDLCILEILYVTKDILTKYNKVFFLQKRLKKAERPK